jgi:hypothetical protein
LSLEFSDHLKQCGIVPPLTPPEMPQWNAVFEQRNRTLLDMVRSMMSQTDLPLSFWGYALETTVFTPNRVPTKSVERTPYEIWTGKHPGLSFHKVWGCETYVKYLMSDKLTPKSDKCFFVGFPRETKGRGGGGRGGEEGGVEVRGEEDGSQGGEAGEGGRSMEGHRRVARSSGLAGAAVADGDGGAGLRRGALDRGAASDSAGRSAVAFYSPTRATDMPPTTANQGATHVHLAADGQGPLGFLFF